ncbi:hypothetical protein [Nonomuraea aurantiaca]|uniref:hypothetical protein n=1 Tax=Nonomuraea aurantiaca TaxID=2878562 RepID=UPI001CD92FB9|nr:hypothetical protein [Nonomuraea aurantiaca]MCA2220393.1 hypothetical protein [Nonomuraea aurantiaca]
MFTAPVADAAGEGAAVAVALNPETANNVAKATIAACLERGLMNLPFHEAIVTNFFILRGRRFNVKG